MKLKISHLFFLCFALIVTYTLTRSFCASIFGRFAHLGFVVLAVGLIMSYFFEYKKQMIKIRKSPFWGLMFAYVIYISMMILVKKKSNYYGFFEYILYLFFFFAICSVLSHVEFEKVMYVYEVVGVVISIEAIWEYFTGNIIYRNSSIIQLMRRAYGLIGSPLTLGMVLACISLISLALAKTKSKFHYIIMMANIIGLIATQSRGPMIAFVIGVFVYLFVDLIMKGAEINVRLLLKVICFVIIIGAVLFVFNNRVTLVDVVYGRLKSVVVWNETDYSNAQRIVRWNIAREMIMNNFLFGYGVSSTGSRAVTGINVESGILKKLAETGVVGFSIYYLMIIPTFIKNVSASIHNKKNIYIPLTVGICVAIFVENFVMQIIDSAAVYLIFMVAFVYIYKCACTYNVE